MLSFVGLLFSLQIWENVTKSKPNAHNETPLSEFFNVSSSFLWYYLLNLRCSRVWHNLLAVYSNYLHLETNDQVEVVALSNYEEKQEQFEQEV